MSLIYKHCLVNIAATTATDGSIGFFFEKNPVLARPCRVSMKEKGIYEFVESSVWFDNTQRGPLNQELGWFRSSFWLLEYFISARHRYFGSAMSW